MNTRKTWLSFIAALVSCALVAGLTVSSSAQRAGRLQKIVSAVSAVIKTVGRRAPVIVCEMALPDEFCEIVVEPVLSALYDDAPYLKPKENDTVAQLNQKAEFAIQHLQRSEKLQQMMISRFSLLRENQDKIIQEIEKLGNTQQEIQISIQTILLNQEYMKGRLDSVVDSQEKRNRLIIREKMTDLMILCRKVDVLCERYIRQVEILKKHDFPYAKGVYDMHYLTEEIRQSAEGCFEDYNAGKMTQIAIEELLEKSRLTLNSFIIGIEDSISNNQELIIKLRK